MYTEELAKNHTWGIDPNDRHIIILEERLLYAMKRREQMMANTPDLTDADLWAIDQDIARKKRELDDAMDFIRRERRRASQQQQQQQQEEEEVQDHEY